MTGHISSYRDLPQMVYQFQNKFRNELRAKSGVMRGKEFLMKDLYSFARTNEEHEAQYAAAREAYKRIFKRLGIGDLTYITSASGGVFSDFSEEFQTLSEAGEDVIYVDEAKKIAVNKEVLTDEALTKLGLQRDALIEKKAIETGNIFHLGTRFSESLGLTFTNEKGEKNPVIMGSYGIGVTRLIGILTEVFGDEKGLVWPESVAPFAFHIVSLGQKGDEASHMADDLYDQMTQAGKNVLYDDRDLRAGEKLADSDLIGIPWRVIVGKEALASGQFEVVNRKTSEVKRMALHEVLAL
jgi:prolyl-tRNA synthetase